MEIFDKNFECFLFFKKKAHNEYEFNIFFVVVIFRILSYNKIVKKEAFQWKIWYSLNFEKIIFVLLRLIIFLSH